MTASLVERQTGSNATFATTPAPGDILVVFAAVSDSSASTLISTPSGMGATWKPVSAWGQAGSISGGNIYVWIGTNPTTAGRLTFSVSSFIGVAAYLIRGANSNFAVRHTQIASATASFAGPTMNAQDGQFVVDFATLYRSGTVTLAGTAPATGWAAAANPGGSFNLGTADITRAVTESGATPHSVTLTESSPNFPITIGQIVVGGTPAPDLPLADVTATASTAATPGTISITLGTGTVVQRVTGSSSSATGTLPFTVAPAAGQLLIVALTADRRNAADDKITGVSGMGASWAPLGRYLSPSTGVGGMIVDVWVGTSPTTSGTVTATVSATGSIIAYKLVGYLVKANSTLVAVDGTSSSVRGSFPGPSGLASVGQVVLDFAAVYYSTNNAVLAPASPTTGGWVVNDNGTTDSYLRTYDASRVVTESAPTAHQCTATLANPEGALAQVIIGGAAPSGLTLDDATGTAAATAAPEAIATGTSATVTDTTATAGAAAAAESVSITQALTADDATAGATAEASAGTLQIAGPAALDDTTAAATATATAERLTGPGGTGLDDTTAPAAAAAHAETLDGLDARAEAWSADQSGQSRAIIDLQPGIGVVSYPPAPAPSNVTERALTRQSHQLPALQPGQAAAAGNHLVVGGTVGVPHVWIGGRDVTYFRGVPTQLGQHTLELPGGPTTLSLTFPQVSPFEPRTGDLAWLQPNAPIEVALVDAAKARHEQWAGRLVAQQIGHTQTESTCSWTATGDLVDDAQHEQHQPPLIQDPEDIGSVIARILTSKVPSRRYGPVKAVTTGILTSQRGSSDDYAWDYVQSLLSAAWTPAGKQWTVKPGTALRQPVIRLKDTGAATWTITVGAPGVQVDIERDETQYTNVIYGRGIGPDGYAWEGRCYPNLRADDAPPFPYTQVGHVMQVGATDAGTDTGHGVSDFQQQIQDLGYPIAVTGVYSADQAAVVEQAQRGAGISVDGQVGPQTWVAFFAVGSNAGNLNASYRRPIAIDPRVDPHLYAANGAITGPNPVYDRSIPRRSRSIDYGDNTTKAQATADARNQLAREMTAGWAGTVTLTTDPWEDSRAKVRPGDQVKLLGWLGAVNLTLQVVAVTRDPSNGYQVTLTVDTLGRDAMTLDSIRHRNLDAKGNRSQRPGNTEKSTKTTIVPFDGESGQAGIVPKFQLNGGYWAVIHIPISIGGQIALVDMRTSAPAAPFVVATFASPITASDLKRLGLGNPFTDAADTAWQNKADALLDLGWIETWGSNSQPCGYYPGSKSDGAKVTGRELDTNPVSFHSNRGGYVWVAVYSPADCYVQGTIKPGPVQP